MDERLGELDPLALSGGHGADRTKALLAEPHLPEGVARPRRGVAPGESVDLGDVAHEVLEGCETLPGARGADRRAAAAAHYDGHLCQGRREGSAMRLESSLAEAQARVMSCSLKFSTMKVSLS